MENTNYRKETAHLAAARVKEGDGAVRYGRHVDGSSKAGLAIGGPFGGAVSVRKLRESYGLKQDTITRLSGFSQRAVANWASGKLPSEATAKRLREMERLLDALANLLEPGTIDSWLKASNPAFDGSTPLQVIERGESDRIWLMIYELASGQPT